jgi:hypothetical protein
MGPIVLEVEKWSAASLYAWRLGTIDRRGEFHVLATGGTGRSSAGFAHADECRIAATDAAIEWASRILAADRLEARRG